MISVKCKGCKSTLRVPEKFAGKKVKCPKCQAGIVVPEEEVVAEVAVEEDDDDREDRVADKPAAKRKPAPRLRDEEEQEDDRREAVRTRRDRDRDPDRDREDEDDRPREKKKKKKRAAAGEYKPCPRCGEEDPKKVHWTWWGSYYGAAIFNQVRCQGCGYAYNGRSGGSNAVAATIMFTLPLLGIIAIFAALFYFSWDRIKAALGW